MLLYKKLICTLICYLLYCMIMRWGILYGCPILYGGDFSHIDPSGMHCEKNRNPFTSFYKVLQENL